MASYRHLKGEIKKFINVITVENAKIIDGQLDELLGNADLMAFIDKMCRKNGATTPIYISYIIRGLNAAYHQSYPANLDSEDAEFKNIAKGYREQYGNRRPSLVECFESIRDYAIMNHPERV